MSSEGQNDNSSSGHPKYDLDLDAQVDSDKKPFQRKIELTLVKQAREEAKEQISSTETLNKQLKSAGVFDALVNMASFQKTIAASIGNAMQVAQPALKVASQLAETHAKLVQSIVPTLDGVKKFGEQMRKMLETITKFTAPILESTKSFSAKVLKSIGSFVKPVLSTIATFKHPPWIDTIMRSIRELLGRFDFSKLFQPFGDFFRLLLKSNFYLVVRASEGDQIAAHKLARIWWKLGREYYRLERLQGREPTENEFGHFIQTTCLEVLKENEHKGMRWGLKAAQTVFYVIVNALAAQYIFINTGKETGDTVEISVYVDEVTNAEYVFLGSLSRQVGVSEQTLRNWIETGELEAIKTSFYSKLRSSKAVAFLVPYKQGIVTELIDLKRVKQMAQRHQLNDLYTVSQVASVIGINPKTLRRWDEQSILVPQRINSIRYYTEAQIRTIPTLLELNCSPRTQALRQKFA